MSVEEGVSYVLTVYNKALYLPSVIKGLREQVGDFPREFIFVDDGSSDDSVAVIERETEGLPNVVIIRQENAGPSWATNAGIAAATMPWVKLLDADDIPMPLSTMQVLKAARATGADAVSADRLLFNWGQDPYVLHAVMLTAEAPDAYLVEDPVGRSMKEAFANPSGWMARRELLLRVGGCDPAVFIQDVSLELRLVAAGRIARLDHPIIMIPLEIEGRASDNQRQILHDINLVHAGFLDQFPDLAARFGRRMARKGVGRAWHWARRREGATRLSPIFRVYLRAILGLGRSSDLIRQSCAAFGGPLRRPPTGRTPPVLTLDLLNGGARPTS